MDTSLVNRVANSGLITFKLEELFPKAEVVHFDLKSYLFMELMLKEKDFREALSAHDWAQYAGKIVLVYCSADAIIPVWAYMLVATYVQPYAAEVFQGREEDFYKAYYRQVLSQLDLGPYHDQRVVVKGCSDHPVPASAYLDIALLLRPVVRSIMFGEPCSTVPIFKQPK